MNSRENASIDLEKEKKTNLKLAIGVTAFVILVFFLLYIMMFALMFLKPGMMFSLMPVPALSKEVFEVNGTLRIVSRDIDFSDISFMDSSEPRQKYMLGVLEDDTITDKTEIEPFYSVASGSDKLYFLAEGQYLTFDGTEWTETKTDAVGKNPHGVVTPEGLIVLSKINKTYQIQIIRENEIESLPMPQHYLSANEKQCANATQLIWFQDQLFLFWSSSGQLYWAAYYGGTWHTIEYSGNYDRIRVITDNRSIYLFTDHVSEQSRGIMLTIYDDGTWLEPRMIDVGTLFITWSPVMYQERLLLYVQGFFHEDIYAIEDGEALPLARLEGLFAGNGFIWKIIQLSLIMMLMYGIGVYLISLVLNKFKLKKWQHGDMPYEFASLIRRFIAKGIDTIVVTLVPTLFILSYVLDVNPETEAFKFIVMVLLLAGYVLVSSFLYHFLFEGMFGKTLGKKLCGIVVLKDDFTPCGLLSGFLRNLMRIVDSFFYYLVAIVSLTGTLKWQRLGDIVAGTVVVRRKKRV
ncbi:MAG: RDD family protein [Nitrospiraceae bacterium]|jgi:uncharacterized RDD family membrane protein YckC|nr:MAG: RDD family protein [Nitrospiraceae bacterium]